MQRNDAAPAREERPQKWPLNLTKCHACRRILDFPYIHQLCQHVVCANCSYGHKSEARCVACNREPEIPWTQGLLPRAGHCRQMADIIEARTAQSLRSARQRLVETHPAVYAEAIVQRGVTPGFAPVRGLIDPGRLRGYSVGDCCCDVVCCCFCIRIVRRCLGWCCRCSCRSMRYVFVALLALFLASWSLVLVNYLWTGHRDLNNLFYPDNATQPEPLLSKLLPFTAAANTSDHVGL